MDPNTKLILDEMNKRFTELDLKWEQRFNEVDSKRDARISVLEDAVAAIDAWKPRTDAATAGLCDWRPWLEASVEDLKLEVHKLHKAWDRVAMDRSGSDPGILEKPLSASVPPPAGFSADGPDGHRVVSHHRDLELGQVFTHTHIPVKEA
ncbi:uncharacterized protein LOC120664436 [Panicum virgatum]|uniref:uncharacterized protein LOC120664436 n=1 Tax=Panicum virgatum TaxID=38727 RepID=UPI0019D52B60|nr:uncharacterized protein LOC120664436 [Panicum virgatum]